MRRLVTFGRIPETALPFGPKAIAAGLTILTVALVLPGVPAVTGMALVALGATSATLAQFRRTTAFVPVMLAHLAIYGGLYALFVGAAFHASAARSGAGVDALTVLDVALSICPLAIALEQMWCELRTGHSTE